MTLPTLASATDLSVRGVDVSNTELVDTMLAVASSEVRGAAGSPILAADVTVSWFLIERSFRDQPEFYVEIPVRPVTGLTSVLIEGDPVDCRLVGNTLWRRGGWFVCEPTEITATLTVGLPTVPDNVKQLVCDLAILGMQTALNGATDPRLITESIDDYSVTYAQGGERVASAMTLPVATKAALRAKFGGGAGSLRFRR